MPKFDHHHRILPAAELTAAELKAIEHALGPEFADSTTWNFWAAHVNVTNGNLDDLLTETQDVKGLTDFEIVADQPDASITISGGPTGCFLEYEHTRALANNIMAKARAIEGIFRGSRRRTMMIPGLSALPIVGGFTRSPSIKIGASGGFHFEINWNDVAQRVIANWISHIGIAVVSFLAGFLIGRFGF